MIVPNKILLLANWKTKPATRAEVTALAKKIILPKNKNTMTVIIPPSIFLSDIQTLLGKNCSYGVQDLIPEETSSCNAQVSPTQAKSVGCDYAIIGHSSLRALGETDADVNQKIHACMKHAIIPIVCIGESQRDIHGGYIDFLQHQIQNSFAHLNKSDFEHIIIAYEPLWAIGAEATREATPSEVEEVRILIEKTIDEMTGSIPIGRITIVYGGSVNTPQQLDDFLAVGMRGVLVGRASIEPETFNSLGSCV